MCPKSSFFKPQPVKPGRAGYWLLAGALLLAPLTAPAQQKNKSAKSGQSSAARADQSPQKADQSAPKNDSGSALVIKETPQIPTDGLAAKVGKGGVTQSEYDFYLLRLSRKLKKTVQTLTPEERKAALNEGIDDELLFQAALDGGMLNDSYVRSMMVSVFKSKNTTETINPQKFTDAELQAYYDANKKEFCAPAEALVKGAKFPSKTEAEDFIKKARQMKDPGSAKDWQNLGWFTEGKVAAGLPQEICDKVVKLKKGQLSDSFPLSRAGGMTYVFLCEDQKAAQQLPFDEVRGKVKFALVNQKQKEGLSALKQKENPEALARKYGADPKKLSEDDTMFLSALNSGVQRDITIRPYCINAYVMRKGGDKARLASELKSKYPVTITGAK
jgi:hypothetical protein